MVKIGPPSPKVNTLDVDDGQTYANTTTETWQLLKFFQEEIVPVDSENRAPEKGKCSICTEDFTATSHQAVRLPCNHVFGKPCIEKWLSPYASARDGRDASDGRDATEWEGSNFGANTCPLCRRVFFPEQTDVDCLPNIEARIQIWDMAYAHVGIALSERERRAREDLLRYINAYGFPRMEIYFPELAALVSPHLTNPSIWWARIKLHRYSLFLKFKELTPVQEQLRQSLERVARLIVLRGLEWAQGEVVRNDEDDRKTVLDGESGGEVECEDESEEFVEGDTEEMRFFRTLFR